MPKRQRLDSAPIWEPVHPVPTRIVPRRGWLALRGPGQRSVRRTVSDSLSATFLRRKDSR